MSNKDRKVVSVDVEFKPHSGPLFGDRYVATVTTSDGKTASVSSGSKDFSIKEATKKAMNK